jgi:two-component system, NtrC family, sensor kinase
LVHGPTTEPAEVDLAFGCDVASPRLPEDAGRLAKIAALALALNPLLDLGRVLEAAEPHLAGLLPGARGYALLWSGDPRRLTHQLPFGAPLPPPLAADTPATGPGLSSLALADRAGRLASGAVRGALAGWELALAEPSEERWVVAAPLWIGADLLGVLLLSSATAPESDDLLLINAACAALGGAVVRARAHGAAQSEKLAGMGRLTAAIAHEVNNPLQAVSNSLHLLLNRSLTDDKRVRYLSMAQKEIEQLIGVVRRMLDFSRPERDGWRPVAVHGALDSVLGALAEQLQESGVVVERQWAEPLLRVSGVAIHLKHAFLNLVLASAELMPAGGTLTVCTSAVPARDGRSELVVVEFRDTGGRLAEEELRTIFEPFHRTRRDISGMGLPVSYTIIEQHGGRISATSSDVGTIFRIELPAL